MNNYNDNTNAYVDLDDIEAEDQYALNEYEQHIDAIAWIQNVHPQTNYFD